MLLKYGLFSWNNGWLILLFSDMILELIVDILMVKFCVDISQNNSYQLMFSLIIG